ncbi:MAG: PilZ domain-containing protein [Planctomycetota bacterium]
MSPNPEQEAPALQRIAEVSGPLLSQTPRDGRRAVQRQNFPAQELVAPYLDAVIPRMSEFLRVPCIDISTRGIGFIWPTEPDFSYVVVALGKPPDVIYLSARIVNCRPDPSQAGGFRVGCQFLGRVVPSAS